MLLNAGPYFRFNPSISFVAACQTKDEVERLWRALSEGGSVLMELGAYAFSEQFGWLQDRFGLSWQIMLAGERDITQKIVPSLVFLGAQSGKAEEAINLYTSVFHHAAVDHIMRRNKDEGPDKAGTVQHADFTLEGEEFAAMDSAHMHEFAFNEAISFVVKCDTQTEIDYYWERLSADPATEQCGWLKDKFGLSWQIVPSILAELMRDPKRSEKVMKALLKMKKLDIQGLKQALERL